MRFFPGLAAAGLAGLATGASQTQADVYILGPQQASSETPQLPRQVARHILSQRLLKGALVDDIPDTIDRETALSYISTYGGSPAPLFQHAAQATRASQLVVILEGSTPEMVKTLMDLASAEKNPKPAFRVSDAPSAKANNALFNDFKGVAELCDAEAAVNPYDESCWKGEALLVKYDLQRDADVYAALEAELPTLGRLAQRGDIEAALVFMPERSRSSKLDSWSTTAPADLHRRVFDESPISDEPLDLPTSPSKQVSPDDSGAPLHWAADDDKKKATIPSCFQSHNSCVTATHDCSGHGLCEDRYAIPGQGSGPKVCFRCRCESTFVDPDKGETAGRVHWGGQMCQKRDVSSPFWLLTGISIVLIGVVTFCVGLLFSVGEEKLPGVIGAGVSRSK